MFKRWEKIDIFIGILFVLTNISYIFLSSGVFKLCLWTLIVVGIIRLLLLIKKKLFWKVRNRLIFSGLFLVATPLFFIAIFFYLILNIVMAQYGMVIMNNLLGVQLSSLERIVDMSLNVPELKNNMIDQIRTTKQPNFNMLYFEIKEDGTFSHTFKYPDQFDYSFLTLSSSSSPTGIDPFSGYFMVGKTLYYGCLKKKDKEAALMCMTVNQEFLDQFGNVSDFRMKFQDPYTNKTTAALEVASDPKLLSDDTYFTFPWMYKYNFLDFNTSEGTKPEEKHGYFWFFLDSKKIYNKISKINAGDVQTDLRRGILLLIFIFGPFIIVSFVIGIRSVRVITRSINLITKGTQRIRNGDFSFRIKTRSRDQLQYLGESFNEMAAGIDRLLIDEKEKQRLEEELRIARSIQLKLLPPDTFITEEFEIAAVNIPAAEIAGDYFDYFYKENEYLSVLVADVSGKGSSAAFYMAELKGVINYLQKEEISPSRLISECHHSLKNSFDRVTFITMNMARFILPEKKFQLARAGHTPALFYDAGKKECIELFPAGVAIGIINFSDDKIKEIEVNYKKGDILFLFSDGLSEIMNDEEEMLGVANLKRLLCKYGDLSAEEIKQRLLDFSIRFSETDMNRDDLTFIILKVK